MSFTSKVNSLARTRSDSYFVERMLHADDVHATVYRRTRKFLLPYASAILFPEQLLLLPCLPGTRRRRVWAVDFEIAWDDQHVLTHVGGKIVRLEYTRLKLGRYETFNSKTAFANSTVPHLPKTEVIASAQRAVEADVSGDRPLGIVHHGPLEFDERKILSLDMYLPKSLIYVEQKFMLDALFAEPDDAIRYQGDMIRYMMGWKTVPVGRSWLPEEK